MSEAVTIRVTRAKVYPRTGRVAWYWHYYAQGPDTIESGGRVLPRRFDNSSVVELRRVLRRAYGRDVQIIEEWKG